MKAWKSRLALGAGFLAPLCAWVLAAFPAGATAPMQKKAKDLGYKVVDGCLYCHGEKLPKKGAATNNARGAWLVSEKEKRKAKEVDVSWLKDYVEK